MSNSSVIKKKDYTGQVMKVNNEFKFRLNMKHLNNWMLDIPCSILEIQILVSHYIDTHKIRKNHK